MNTLLVFEEVLFLDSRLRGNDGIEMDMHEYANDAKT
jgi:hypothetical protein